MLTLTTFPHPAILTFHCHIVQSTLWATVRVVSMLSTLSTGPMSCTCYNNTSRRVTTRNTPNLRYFLCRWSTIPLYELPKTQDVVLRRQRIVTTIWALHLPVLIFLTLPSRHQSSRGPAQTTQNRSNNSTVLRVQLQQIGFLKVNVLSGR